MQSMDNSEAWFINFGGMAKNFSCAYHCSPPFFKSWIHPCTSYRLAYNVYHLLSTQDSMDEMLYHKEFKYIKVWINSVPEPTWRNFFRVFKGISPDLDELIYQIKEIFHGEKHAVRRIIMALLSLELSPYHCSNRGSRRYS